MKEALKLALEALEEPHPGVRTSFTDAMTYREKIKTAIAAIKALAQSEQEPVLQDIEQYRLQMAGISTAAIGYWKEGDGIHPDYDTLALRDVAKLYSKYDELYKAQLEQEPVAWKLVPVEPTEGMLKAMDECSTEGYDERLYAGHAASVYMAAVDAAPTQPTAHRTAGANFCPRCGKRLGLDSIHTCTPPREKT